MFSSLDNAFASYAGHGELADTYTTGTTSNLIMQAGVAALLDTLSADLAHAERLLQAASFSSPGRVLTAVTAAGNLATDHATISELIGAQRALQRL